MNKASELRAQLKNTGLAADAVDRIVKSEIAAGKVSDDGTMGSIPIQLLIDAAEGLKTVEATEPPQTSTGIMKGGPALGEDLADMLRAVCANAESLVEYQNEVMPTLAKGMHAQGTVIEALVDAMGSMETIMKGVLAKLDEPVAPRGVTPGAAPVLHRNENIAKGGQAAGEKPQQGVPRPVSREKLHEALRDKQDEMIRKGEDPDTIIHIGGAIAALENTTASVPQILKQYDISLG